MKCKPSTQSNNMTNCLLVFFGAEWYRSGLRVKHCESPELNKGKLSTEIDSKPFLWPGFFGETMVTVGDIGLSWKPVRREHLVRSEINCREKERKKKEEESGNGPQSLSLPPTRQDMPKARGMPHIYFPSFPFLITTHAQHKQTSPWLFLPSPLHPLFFNL